MKISAVKRVSSILGFLNRMLERLVGKEDDYERAMRRQLRMMKEGLDLGTYGNITVTRDELHER